MSWMVESRCAIASVVRPAIRTLQRVADGQLGLGVHARRRLVEDEDLAGRRPAPGRTTAAASARPTGSRRARRPAASYCCGIRSMNDAAWTAPPRALRTASSVIGGVAQPDVRGDRPRKQVHVLEDEAELGAQGVQVHRADVDAVDEDAAAGDVVEPEQQVDQRRLSRARRADDPDPLARGAHRTTRSAGRSPSRYRQTTRRRRRCCPGRRGQTGVRPGPERV